MTLIRETMSRQSNGANMGPRAIIAAFGDAQSKAALQESVYPQSLYFFDATSTSPSHPHPKLHPDASRPKGTRRVATNYQYCWQDSNSISQGPSGTLHACSHFHKRMQSLFKQGQVDSQQEGDSKYDMIRYVEGTFPWVDRDITLLVKMKWKAADPGWVAVHGLAGWIPKDDTVLRLRF